MGQGLGENKQCSRSSTYRDEGKKENRFVFNVLEQEKKLKVA